MSVSINKNVFWNISISVMIILFMTYIALPKIDLNIGEERIIEHQQVAEDYNKLAQNKQVNRNYSNSELEKIILSYLSSKYASNFVIDKSYRVKRCRLYKHPIFYTLAHKVGKDDFKFAVIYKLKSNKIIDKYKLKHYIKEAAIKLNNRLRAHKLKGKIQIDYPVNSIYREDIKSSQDIIRSNHTSVTFVDKVKDASDVQTYVPRIRKWLKYLYKRDYDWHYILKSKNKRGYEYINLMKGDFNYHSESEWSDDDIISLIWESIEINKSLEGSV